MKTFEIHNADCREVMRSLPENSIDSIVTDPPYGLEFMGKGWDRGVPGVEFWTEAIRILKPGGHILAFGGTRTFHRLTVAIEDSGFEIRDCLGWIYGSGFPKSHNIRKAIERGEGATPEAAEWEGWGTALKPAWEPIILARKPLAGTVAANVLAFRTGALNIDAARVNATNKAKFPVGNNYAASGYGHGIGKNREAHTEHLGRWPANVIHDGSEEVLACFPELKAGIAVNRNRKPGTFNSWLGTRQGVVGDDVGYGDSGSAARFFYCAKASKADREEGCEEIPLSLANTMDIGSDTGRDENNPRNAMGGQQSRIKKGLPPTAPRRNLHPTVKPFALMSHLCRLVTPPGGLVLDPFAGSGSTGKAAIAAGFQFVGAELDPAYAEIARARCEAAAAKIAPAPVAKDCENDSQLNLFEGDE